MRFSLPVKMLLRLSHGLADHGRWKAAQDTIQIGYQAGWIDSDQQAMLLSNLRMLKKRYALRAKVQRSVIREVDNMVNAERVGRAAMDKATR